MECACCFTLIPIQSVEYEKDVTTIITLLSRTYIPTYATAACMQWLICYVLLQSENCPSSRECAEIACSGFLYVLICEY